MNETVIGLGSSYLKVVIKTLQAWRGVGVTRLMFSLELTNKDRESIGYPLWLGGRVEVHVAARGDQYLGRLGPSTPQPVGVMSFGQETSAQLTLDLTDQQFLLLDETRTRGGARLMLTLAGHAMIKGEAIAIQTSQALQYDISQSEWLGLIEQAGLRRRLLLELEAPDPMAHPERAQALDYYNRALARYRDGDWRECVESLRQSLSALVGKKPDDDAQEVEITDAMRDARANQSKLGYPARAELVRKAARFMTDLGAHPETAETHKPDAHAALMIAGGLLHSFSSRITP